MIHPQQKALLHIYKGAAALSDPSYRQYLAQAAGVSSAADPRFNQAGFETAMASLETVLFQRVETGEVPDPRGRSRYIQDEYYWRNRLPRSGQITSRQAHRIEELWSDLVSFLPVHQQTLDYLGAIVRKATGKPDPGYTALTHREAACLIDALCDRIAHAHITHSPDQLEEVVPF
jgi:hypothetical protein